MYAIVTIALVTLTATALHEPTQGDVTLCVAKGLKWLAAQQKTDGSWVGRNDRNSITVTAFAGLALLMEGSTLKHGTYAPELRMAVAWFAKNAAENGRLANGPAEDARNIQGHAHALMFLSSAYDTDDDHARRKQLGRLIERAVAFATDSQGKRGGWGVASVSERTDDDSLSTILMLQGLFAARKAGIEVPKTLTDKGTDYLAKATSATGGVFTRMIEANSPGSGAGQPQLTAGSVATHLMHDGPRPPVLTRWVGNLKPSTSIRPRQNAGAMFTHLQFARVAFALGENGHRKIDPTARDADLLSWSSYRTATYETLKSDQLADGNWPDMLNGPVYSTSLALIILQLDNDYLPAFAR